MVFLKSKRLLIKVSKLSQKKEEKIYKREIEKKIHQIKYLASRKKISKNTLKKEITNLEKLLRGVLLLEKKIKEKEKKTSKEITAFKKQIKDLKQKMSAAGDTALRKKVEKLSHLVGDLMAREVVKKEVNFEEVKKKIEAPERPAPIITLKKIDEFQEKIFALKKSGKCPPEKIAQLKKRLADLEKKLPVRAILGPKETVKHEMLFGPKVEEIEPVTRFEEVTRLEEEIDKLPPPPKKKK